MIIEEVMEIKNNYLTPTLSAPLILIVTVISTLLQII